ncbi:MAG: ROK family protein [candidate division CPR1 bacterium GW2011_GWC1_49_13]|uniref:ROK family protein n=1 Tax=candidate division CPR1 bacterium GW2011_GWC1_49_13 TaxID=1618342 RepID=A0A0G1VFY6_9BACT|nr:MAG: ROK family protein [candidate division CPR1 bacterium GW2011_GWC1_49_13]
MATLGLDIGASKIHFAVLKEDKKVAEGSYPNTPPSLEELVEILTKLKEELNSKEITISRIGVGVPGNPKNGTLAAARNFPQLVNFPLSEKIKTIFGITPAPLVNDAFAFTYAEAKIGAGKGFKKVVGVTLGSGLGSGLVVNGKLYDKSDWPAIRQAILNEKDGLDAEDLASQKFFKNQGQDAKETAAKTKEGDPTAQDLWIRFGRNLGDFLGEVAKILDPQVIVLGGGIANDFDLFAEATKQRVQELIDGKKDQDVVILPSNLGPGAGAIGAALLAG